MNILRYIFLLLLINLNLYSFDSIEILNPNITIHKSGYVKTNKDLSPQEAFNYANTNELSQLPKSAKSFGYDENTYWYYFEISTKDLNSEYYLDLKHTVTEYAFFYQIDENKNIKNSQKSGYALSSQNRNLNTLPVRFKLENNENKISYLLKINTKNTQYAAFAFGDANDLNIHWYILYGIIFVTFGVFLGLISYNSFLMIILKDKTYLYYILYTTSLIIYILFDSGLISFFIDNNLNQNLALVKFFEVLALSLFTINFLELKNKNPKIYLIFKLVIFFIIILFLFYLFNIGKSIILIFISIFSYFLIYVGFVSYKNGNKIAPFFLLSTIGGLIFINIFFLMPLKIMPLNLFGLNLLNIALIWDMVTLSLALAYRIRLLQEEKETNQKLALIKSKQSSLGEISGNIAHQWRQPLAELGSINTNIEAKLKFSEISKKELLEKLEINKNILNHLSQTINTFQSFFQNSNIETKFCINDEIKRCIDFVNDSMKNNQISIKFSSDNNYFLQGNANEFSQIILNIILNAKDALCERNIENRTIFIKINSFKSEFKIEISDNAGGIKIEPIESIFESYITSKDKGIGIGLFIVKTLVEEKFKGNIFISNGEFGAIFSLSFSK